MSSARAIRNAGHGRQWLWCFDRRTVILSMCFFLTATTSWQACRVSAHVLATDLVPAGWSLSANTPGENAGQSFCRFTNDSTLPADAMRKQFCCNVTSHLINDVTQIDVHKASVNDTGVPTTGSVIRLPATNGSVSLRMHTPVFVGCAYNISWDIYKSVHDDVEHYLQVISTTQNTTGGFKGQMYDGPGQMPLNGHYIRPATNGQASHGGHTMGTTPPTTLPQKNGVVKQERLPTIATWVAIALVFASAHLHQMAF